MRIRVGREMIKLGGCITQLLPDVVWYVPMTIHPEEFVTLSNHGTMKLRSAVARTMILLPEEREQATIVREGEPTILTFEQIRDLAAEWEFVPSE